MTKNTVHKIQENRKATEATPDFTPNFYNPHEVKHRRRTSRGQAQILERSFHENSKPNGRVREDLANNLAMSPRGVQIWFQNRRAKAKQQIRVEKTPPTVCMSTPMVHSNSQSSMSSYPESLDNFQPPLFDDTFNQTWSEEIYPIPMHSSRQFLTDQDLLAFSDYQNDDWLKPPCHESYFTNPSKGDIWPLSINKNELDINYNSEWIPLLPIKSNIPQQFDNVLIPYLDDMFNL